MVSVDSNGKVTALRSGEAKVYAKATDGSGISSDECNITVITLAESLALDAEYLVLEINEEYQFEVEFIPEDVSNTELTWTSSNPSVVQITGNGIIVGKSIGRADVTATTTDGTNLSATCKIIVLKKATSLTLNKTELELHTNETATLTAKILPSDATIDVVEWSSTDSSIVSVDDDGNVTALSAGTAYIEAATIDGSELVASNGIGYQGNINKPE